FSSASVITSLRVCRHLHWHLLTCDIYFFFSCYGGLPALHSFPTRRSSDLPPPTAAGHYCRSRPRQIFGPWHGCCPLARNRPETRSEEHRSELQSRENLVCRLLLEKKTRNNHQPVHTLFLN